MKHLLEYWAFRVMRVKWSFLPEGLATRSAALIGLLAGSVLRIRRREVDQNLAIAFPDESPAWRRRIARRSYMHLGREAAMLFRMSRWSRARIRERVRLVDFDMVREAIDENEGVVVLTGHLGNWEMAGAGIAAHGLALDVVGKGMANRHVQRDLFATRERLGMRVIEMSDAPREVLRSLRQGRVTALLGDQNAHRYGVFVPFFGKLAATSRGVALFPIRTEVPVFVGFALREPGWTHSYVLVARRLEYERTGDLETDIRSLLLAYHRALEEAIREAPDQYFWQHRRWKTRPGEEQGQRSQVT